MPNEKITASKYKTLQEQATARGYCEDISTELFILSELEFLVNYSERASPSGKAEYWHTMLEAPDPNINHIIRGKKMLAGAVVYQVLCHLYEREVLEKSYI